MNAPQNSKAGAPAATDIVIAHGIDSRGWRRFGGIVAVIGLAALLPLTIAIVAFGVFLAKWAIGAATR